MAREETEPNVYNIPKNAFDTGYVFGGLFRTRNFVEGIIVALPFLGIFAYGWTKLGWDILSTVAYCVILCAGAFMATVVGVDGDSLFEFIARVIRFRKNRRISKYNPRIKTELEPDYLIHDDKLLPREKLKRAYESIKGKVVGGEENAISADINSDNLHIYYDDDENFIEKPEELKTQAELKADDAFMHCDVNKLAEAFASMYHSDGEECDRLGCAKQEVNEAFMRMKTITPKVETNQSILLVCKDFGDTGDDVSLIKAKDLSVWKEKHKEKTETISDEMLTFMSTDDIIDAAMQQELPTRYAIELCSWDEILGWKLAPSSIYIYGLEFCLSRVLWEMTFFGVEPHGVEKAKADLDASIEESKKNLDENGKPHGIPFEDFVKELLGDDYTEDWYPEEEQERDRRNMAIASYKGNKEAEYLLLML